MKFKKIALAAAVAVIGTTSAHAFSWNTSNVDTFSSVVGATTIDFGVGAVGTTAVAGTNAPNETIASGTVASAGGSTNYQFVEGALYNLATSPNPFITARPVGSAGNFWSVGTSPAEQSGPGVLSFSTAATYIGFLWGSVDVYNKVSFYSGDNNFLTLTGADVATPADGNQSVAKYFNFFSEGQYVTKVVFESNGNAFETDNFAVTAVPEVETYAMMLAGLGLMGTIVRRRNKAKTA